VDFGRFCSVQNVSWYAGIVQVGAALLTVVIYALVYMRRRTKGRMEGLRARVRGGSVAM
jgi:hypothetical protein